MKIRADARLILRLLPIALMRSGSSALLAGLVCGYEVVGTMTGSDIYLTVGDDPKGRGLLAIISRGHPQKGDENCTVLTLEVVKNMKAAKAWFRRMKVEQPWEARQ